MLSNPKEAEKLDPRVKRTRSLILRSFESLLAEKGFETISVQDVTDKAEVNRATFYAHFHDKYELLDYSISQMFRQEIEKRRIVIWKDDGNLVQKLLEYSSQSERGAKGIPIRIFVSDNDHSGWLTNQLKKRIHLNLPDF